MTDQKQIQTLSVQGKEYIVEDLPKDLQRLLELYSTWEAELVDTKIEVFKLKRIICRS